MNKYQIVADSTYSLPIDVVRSLNIEVVPLTFNVGGEEEVVPNKDEDLDYKKYYDLMRNGTRIRTSAIAPSAFREMFEKVLKQGKDVIYIGFSGGLSSTYKSSQIVAEELRNEYKNNKIYTVDTRAGSATYGIILIEMVKKQNEGATIDELYEYSKYFLDKAMHLVSVEDLKYLRDGGRLSAPSYLIGKIVQIKPIVQVSKEGKVVSIAKCIGRKRAFLTIAEMVRKTIIDPEKYDLYITDADARDSALQLADMIRNKVPNARIKYSTLDMIIGTHLGPGTVGVFFIGKNDL